MAYHKSPYCFLHNQFYGYFPDWLLFEPLCGFSGNICAQEQAVIPIFYGGFGVHLPKLYFP
jgi:hypothetical protein